MISVRSRMLLGALVATSALLAPPLFAAPVAGPPADDPLADPDPQPVDPLDDPVDVSPDPDPNAPPPDTPPERDNDLGLPPKGRATLPAMPYIESDLIDPRQGGVGRGSAQVALSKIGEDLFLDLAIGTTLKFDKWRIAPRLPLRIRLDDNAPKDDDIIRTEDWDEVSDFARVLRYIQYGRVGDPYIFRYGELSGVSIGHGALVNRYSNTIDLDHYQGGVFSAFDAPFIGGEVLLDNVLGPELFVGRAYVRPFSFVDSWPLPLREMKFGVTAGADFSAPLVILQGDGKLFSHPDRSPVVLADEVVGLLGFDLEVPVVSQKHIDVVPYFDLASVDGSGVGVHLGSFINLRFDVNARLRLKLEYRYVGEGHEPGYISPFYEIERYQHRSGVTKLEWLKRGDGGKAHHSFYFEGDLRVDPWVRFGLIYSRNGGERGHDLLMRLRLPKIGPISVTLYFARLGFDGDNFYSADQTVWGTSVKWTIAELFFVRVGVVNEWWLPHSDDGRVVGYETTTNYDFGAGLYIRF